MNNVHTNKRLIKEDPDEVFKNDGTRLYWDASDSHPFFFDKGMGMLVMGGAGLNHDDMLGDVYDALAQYAPDPSEQDDYFNAFMSEYESTDPNLVTGRIWTEEKIISLWGSTDRPTMKNIAYAFSEDYGINVDDYELDMDDELIPLATFLQGAKETPQFTHPEIHTMPSAQKWATPQLQGARDAVSQAKAEKLGGTSEAEYNFYRRYGLGDSVQHDGQPLRESPDSIWIPDKLDLSYEDDDAYPFIYDLETKQLFLAGEGNTHEWIENEIEDYIVDNTDWYETDRDKVHNFIDRVLSRETDSSVIGRLWYRHGVISFWKMPKTQTALKETIDALCKDFGQNIWDYDVELDTGLAPLKSLLHKDDPQETHFDLNTIHNLSPKEKWNTPQLRGARETAARIKAEKFGTTPEAKYNFYRRYGMGDSVQHDGQTLNESPDSLMWTNERGKPEEIYYGADDARPFFYDTENDDLYIFPQNITHYGIISWVASEMKKKHPEMSDEECKKRAKEADNRRSAYGASGRIWTDSNVISFWNTPNVDVLEKIVKRFNEQGIKIEDYTLDFYDFADDTTLGNYIENEKETDYSGMTPEPWFDLDIIHNLPAEEKWNTPQLRGARETAAKLKSEKLGSMPQAKYNFYRRYGMGDSVQHNSQPLTESPDRLYYNNGDENDVFINFKTNDAYPFVYDKTDGMLYIGLPGAWHSFLIEWIAEEVMENHPEMDEEEAMAHSEDVLSRTSENSVCGRIWQKHKVISFWSDPSLEEMEEVASAFKGQGIDILSYKLDIDNTAERPLADYLNGENLKKSNFDTTIVHNLSPKEKWNSPQIKAARDARYDAMAKKLGNTPEAEYNFYRRYGMGDSKETDNAKQINEVDAQNISLQSFEPKDELNPKFWVNGKLNSNVRIKLLQIAHNFMDESKVNWVEPEDVVLTGSIANYNWSKYSDVDVHIILDYNKVWKKTEFVEDYFGDKKELWSNTHPNLKIYGFPVEVYVEDLNTPADSSGIYSLLRNEWLKEPVDFNDSIINAEYVKNYAARIETKIDRIIVKMRKERNAKKIEDYSKALQAIFDKLKNLRKEGLRKGGEMGSGNIIWKICKRMGYLDKLWDSVNLAYDRAHSIA